MHFASFDIEGARTVRLGVGVTLIVIGVMCYPVSIFCEFNQEVKGDHIV